MLILTKEQTLLNISTTNISALNSKEIQPSNAEDAFVSTISPIIAVAFAMMGTSPPNAPATTATERAPATDD